MSTCPDGFYHDLTTRTCQHCSPQCLTCQSSATFCTSCTNATLLLKNNRCQVANACDPGSYYDTEKKRCQFCDITCKQCESREQNACTECLAARPLLLEGKCVARCPERHWQMEGECLECSVGCTGCGPGGVECTGCLPGYVLTAGNQCEVFRTEGKY